MSSGGASPLPQAASTLVTSVLPSGGYKLALRVESDADFLLYLAQFPLDAGGTFSVAVDLALRVDPPLAARGRSMLRLLACDAAAVDEILRLALETTDPLAPRYCSMADGRTLSALCASFPLADRVVGDAVVYRAQAVVSGSAVRDLGIRASSSSGSTTFFLDACEAVGGEKGVLLSCLTPAAAGADCFRCAGVPSVGVNCSEPPAVRPAITGGVWMDLCTASGDCHTASGAFASLPLFYALAALVWAASAFVWSVHIQAASRRPPRPRSRHTRQQASAGAAGPILTPSATPSMTRTAVPVDGPSASRRGSRESSRPSGGRLASAVTISPPAAQVVVALQFKMRGVPLSQSLASALAAAALFLERSGGGTASSASPTALSSLASNTAALAAMLALALLCELLLLLSRGWQITRATLPARERQWLRALPAAFALLTGVLRHSRRAKHLVVVLLWGAAWAALVGSLWFHSALNLNALRYQLAALRQHLLALQQQQQRDQQALGLDPQPPPPPPDVRRTPVYVKLQLFRRLRALLALYLLLACVLGVAALAADTADAAWQWTTLAAADGLTFLLAAALGFTFRCRRFRELLPPNPDTNTHANTDANLRRVAPEPPAVAEGPPPPLVRAKSAVVVVVSPGKEHALGTAYATVDATNADVGKEPA